MSSERPRDIGSFGLRGQHTTAHERPDQEPHPQIHAGCLGEHRGAIGVLGQAVIEEFWLIQHNNRKSISGIVELTLTNDAEGQNFQFERHGYFVLDPIDHDQGSTPVFNLPVGLGDSWGKLLASWPSRSNQDCHTHPAEFWMEPQLKNIKAWLPATTFFLIWVSRRRSTRPVAMVIWSSESTKASHREARTTWSMTALTISP